MTTSIVRTIGTKCKRCYSCVRECPAIAIRIENGQAVLVEERCISCGHCIKVCSQHAKQIKSDAELTLNTILPTGRAAAIVAPSFAASFPDTYNKIPTALRKIGFKLVAETAFGADLISPLYAQALERYNGKTIISTACPAVFNYIEKYHDELVPNLAKIVSPMVAMGRYIKANFGSDMKVVFIGPCVAKKSEYQEDQISDSIDAVLTFFGIKNIFKQLNIDLNSLEDSEFDPPHALVGKSYPLAGGLLKTANISSDILEKEIIVVEGKDKVLEIINEVANNKINAKMIDILFCEGCINGPAIDSHLNYYSKREKIIKYIHEKINLTDKQLWKSTIYNSRNLNLKRKFKSKNQRHPTPDEEKIKEILARSHKYTEQDELNCNACGFETCREYASAIAKGLAEEDMCLPYLIEKLEKAYDELKSTQEQLQSAEKLASIGQLAAGVAHEINNPLGTILLYSSMLRKDIAKLENTRQFSEDVELIIDETNRCKNIVSNLLNFARQGKLKLTAVNVQELISEIIKIETAAPENRNISITIENGNEDLEMFADSDQLRQVFLNIISNAREAFDDTADRKINVKITKENEFVNIEIKDNGCGIPKENLGKLFTPFFTTKKMGKGTGLGLAITYGIIKMHRGDIKVQSTVGEGTSFLVKLPLDLNESQIMN